MYIDVFQHNMTQSIKFTLVLFDSGMISHRLLRLRFNLDGGISIDLMVLSSSNRERGAAVEVLVLTMRKLGPICNAWLEHDLCRY
jgi:hypothetical protein